jgi:hypothetical protein
MIGASNWHVDLAAALSVAEAGDTLVVPTAAQCALAQRAARRTRPDVVLHVEVREILVRLPEIFGDEIEAVGISGTRAPQTMTTLALGDLLGLSAHCIIHVGDAAGVDTLTRILVPDQRRVNYDVAGHRHAGKLVERSIRMVNTLALLAAHAVLVAFPDTNCPAGLVPSTNSRACFAGQKNRLGRPSGTWKTLAYAAGLRIRGGSPRCLLYLPPQCVLPVHWTFQAVSGLRPSWWEVIPPLDAAWHQTEAML